MSPIAMTIIDPCRTIHGRPHGSFADVAVAALSAEPETVEDVEAAPARFIEPHAPEYLAAWSKGACDEPYDAGICIVDLPARLVVVRSPHSSPGRKGEVRYCGIDGDKDVWVPYHSSDDWLFGGRTRVSSWRANPGKAWQAVAKRPARCSKE